MAKTGRPILIDQAGPSRAPAAVLHPDDPIPKTWRVVSEWSYRGGQRGAWLDRDPERATGWKIGHPATPMLAQIVYRRTAKRSPRVSTTGNALGHASRALVCTPWELWYSDIPRDLDDTFHYHAPKGTEAQAEADHHARAKHLGINRGDLNQRDKEAVQRYMASLQQPSPPPAPAAPAAAMTSALYFQLLGVARMGGLNVVLDEITKAGIRDHMSDAEWDALVARFRADLARVGAAPAPRQPQPDLIDELDLPMRAYNALKRNDVTRVHHLLGLSDSQILRMRGIGDGGLRDIDAKLAAHGLKRSAQGVNRTPGEDAEADIPTEAGVERAKWLGDRIAAMTSDEDSGYLPHTRRRIAAHRALSIVQGYTPQDAENDGCLLPGGLMLHLEGLNALAARAFAGQEV